MVTRQMVKLKLSIRKEIEMDINIENQKACVIYYRKVHRFPYDATETNVIQSAQRIYRCCLVNKIFSGSLIFGQQTLSDSSLDLLEYELIKIEVSPIRQKPIIYSASHQKKKKREKDNHHASLTCVGSKTTSSLYLSPARVLPPRHAFVRNIIIFKQKILIIHRTVCVAEKNKYYYVALSTVLPVCRQDEFYIPLYRSLRDQQRTIRFTAVGSNDF